MKDLSLIPIEDLVEELFNRSEACVIGTTRIEDNKEPIVRVYYNDASILTKTGLCDVLKRHMIKQWEEGNGELE